MIDITPIINALILALAAWATPRILDWLSTRTTAEERKNLEAWAKIAVAAAEQIYAATDGELKKKYARSFIEQRLAEHGLTVDLSVVNDVLEAAVLELHHALYGTEATQ